MENNAILLSRFRWLFPVVLLFMFAVAPIHAGEGETKKDAFPPLSKAFSKVTPQSVGDLKAIQERVRVVVEKVMPAVVGVRIGAGQGSGVIISEDGYVLTAAHVSGPAGRRVTIFLPDGKKLRGETLGANKRIDAGLIRITSEGKWPHVDMGDSKSLERGNWCLAIGHPRGYQTGRTPPVRLGRVLDNLPNLIRTDCTLVGGDSGGPLFDMDGKVIGIHSRIGPSIIYNIHVPVNYYRDDFDRMAKSEVFPSNDQPWIGVVRDQNAKDCRIAEVAENSPAAKAGIKVNDVIVSFNGRKIGDFEDLIRAVERTPINARVDVVLQRDGEMVNLKLRVGKRAG